VEPKLLYWTGALVDLALVVGFAVSGVRARRRGDVPRHRRQMLVGAALVGLFLVSYLVKLLVLGREDMGAWSRSSIWVLRLHECCVFSMLVAGGVAGWRGHQLRRTRNATRDPADPPAPVALARGHRLAGGIAVVSAGLGLLTAILVLAGMYQRAGLL
jgi:hypothetical protein